MRFENIERLVKRAAGPNGATLAIHRARDDATVSLGAGDLAPDTPYFAASTTKLYLTAILLQLAEEGRLTLDDPLALHLPGALLDRLDPAGAITIRMAMGHTSGLPDYFQHEVDGRTLQARISAGEDSDWSVEDVIGWAAEMGRLHPPGETRKSTYSDTNYQLLGAMVEETLGAPLADIMRARLIDPLGLTHTWLYDDPVDRRPLNLRYKSNVLDVPRAMTSFRGDGGIATAAQEGLQFVRAFFGGVYFPRDRIAALCHWRKMFFPLEYGDGLMRYRMSPVLTGFRRLPELIGHSGLSGAFIFAAPSEGYFLAGTVNQIARPGRTFQLMTRVLTEMCR